MSKISDLIARLCPNGVEFKPLREVAEISRGGNFQKKDYVDRGFPCIHYGQIYTLYGLFVRETANFISNDKAASQRKAVTGDIIMAVTSENIEDVCKCVAWLGDGEIAVSGHTAIIHHSIDAKYLVYYFHSSMFYAQKLKLVHGTKVMEVSPNSLGEIEIPVPPLEVQREIVRILDTFTELTAELTLRKKQYEYYRDLLLTFDIGGGHVEHRKLGECVEKVKKISWQEAVQEFFYVDLSSVDIDSHKILDVIRIDKNNAPNRAQQILKANDVLFGSTRPMLKRYCSVPEEYDGQICSTGFCVLRANTELVLPRWLYHNAASANFFAYIERTQHGASYPMISDKDVLEFKISVPPLSDQERIVEILDKFDKYCNDLRDGLPAEIDKRRRQYEHYRDELLTFK